MIVRGPVATCPVCGVENRLISQDNGRSVIHVVACAHAQVRLCDAPGWTGWLFEFTELDKGKDNG